MATPSKTLQANEYLMRLYAHGEIPLEKLEKWARGTERLKEVFSSVPYYAQRGEKDPNYWNDLFASRVNWYPVD